jgi:hypothetical protein
MSFKLHIIESPSPEDFLVGRQEGDALYKILKLGGIEVAEPKAAITKVAFSSAISEITNHFKSSTTTPSTVPWLHISSHGDDKGISFSAPDQSVTWKELGEILRPLNSAIGGKLLVSMSSCYGQHGFNMARDLGDDAFHSLIGPMTAINWSDMLVAYSTFYHHVILKGSDIKSALEAMHIASGVGAGTFDLVSCKKEKQKYLDQLLAAVNQLYPILPSILGK